LQEAQNSGLLANIFTVNYRMSEGTIANNLLVQMRVNHKDHNQLRD